VNSITESGDAPPTNFGSGSFRMSAFDASLISTILPRLLQCGSSKIESHAFQSVLDLWPAETAEPSIASSRLN